jgi:mRNA interferase MazF
MLRTVARKQVLVQLDDLIVERLDRLTGPLDASRSDLIRRAVRRIAASRMISRRTQPGRPSASKPGRSGESEGMRRGDLYWARLPEPRGRRPVVIVSRTMAVRVRPVVTIAPVTRRVRGLDSELPLGPNDGLGERCVANCDNLETISKSRLTKQIGTLDSHRLVALDDALRYALGIRT